jgi:hypothetical protein
MQWEILPKRSQLKVSCEAAVLEVFHSLARLVLTPELCGVGRSGSRAAPAPTAEPLRAGDPARSTRSLA